MYKTSSPGLRGNLFLIVGYKSCSRSYWKKIQMLEQEYTPDELYKKLKDLGFILEANLQSITGYFVKMWHWLHDTSWLIWRVPIFIMADI